MLFDVDKNHPDRDLPAPNHSDALPEDTRMAHQTLSTSYSPPGTVNIARVQMQGNRVDIVDNDNALVATYGQQPDGTINLRFYDSNEIPVAQFGRFSDGSTALKVAKSGQDVSTAPDTQLIFNSNQDIFKISTALSGSLSWSIPSHTTGGATIVQNGDDDGGTLTLPHNLGIIPAIQSYVFDGTNYAPIVNGSPAIDTGSGWGLGLGFRLGLTSGTFSNVGLGFVYHAIWADTTNVYIKVRQSWVIYGASNTLSAKSGSFSYKVYCLQETAN